MGRILLTLLLALFLFTSAFADGASDLARIQALLDAGKPDAASRALDRLPPAQLRKADALLLRSTAALMLGDRERGEADLDKALKLDPSLRQGWLNRAALLIADERYPEAQKALEKAQKLDPQAEDNYLNLGAVQLLQGQLQPAQEHFQAYLEHRSQAPQAHFLIATNYAINGYSALAIEHLAAAIEGDESYRILARTDARFGPLSEQPGFQQLLSRDVYRLPPNAFVERRPVSILYGEDGGELLIALLDALRRTRIAFRPQVEVTADWALVTGDVRIKISNQGQQGWVEISALPGAMTRAQFQQKAETIFANLTPRPVR
jgi:tetratricopeptide (TPR) repeat protein